MAMELSMFKTIGGKPSFFFFANNSKQALYVSNENDKTRELYDILVLQDYLTILLR